MQLRPAGSIPAPTPSHRKNGSLRRKGYSKHLAVAVILPTFPGDAYHNPKPAEKNQFQLRTCPAYGNTLCDVHHDRV